MKCIVCGKEVPMLATFNSTDPADCCWSGGVVDWLTAGYGSAHDMDRFLICVCDGCLETKGISRSRFVPPPPTPAVKAFLKRLRLKSIEEEKQKHDF